MKGNNIKNLKLKIINFFKKIYYRFFPVWRKEKKRYYLKQKKLTKKYSKYISKNIVFSSTNYQPNLREYVIELAGIRKFYYDNKTGKKIIFENINLKIKKGEFVVIVGPSGAGKTTIFNIMSGIDKVTYGDVFVKGKNLSFLNDKELTSFRRDNIGLIFQKSLLFNDLTTKDNVKVTWYLLNNENKLIENERIKEVFKDVSMYEHINKYPYQLSGGEQQRISIAMALIKNPDILFCD
jgi:putative ABC transport system ATP-binding protein